MARSVYNPTARTYQAPLQLKSTGGIFIRSTTLAASPNHPQALVNRLEFVPLEENKDILAPQSGRENSKCPSTRLVVFSTIFHSPNESLTKPPCAGSFSRSSMNWPHQ